ncbi:type II toxin-antitoxin system Phd/YefM family antitoxin [Thermovenabulum sp.]|uniref:type II toxin-antitoxin system Phd/YefM family antitoxin n=1 Tax=Thermovenabulum sp. TaxID=3100335 RepID=UPI003C7A429C
MRVTSSEFKMRAGKYLKLVEKEPIIITKNGKEIAKLVPINQKNKNKTDFLYGLLKNYKEKDYTLKQIRNERIKKYENND